MGEVFYGNTRLRVSGPAGTTVSLTGAYSLKEDGSLRTRDNRAAEATDTYILKGKGQETWSPRFKGQGFRRLWVRNWPGTPTVDNFTGQVIRMDVPVTGSFSCSDDLINKIYNNIRRTQQMYLRTVPMDPDRDERQGWIGDQNQNILSYSYSWNIYPFFSKWLGDLRLDQRENGHLPVVTPAFWEFYNKSMLWPSGITLIPELLRQQYGDPQAIRENYATMHKWMGYLETKINDEGIFPVGNYGDWCDVYSTKHGGHRGKTPIPLLATAYYYRHCVLMEQFALMQNLPAEAEHYQRLGKRTKAAFNKKFLNVQTGEYQTDTQTAYAVAIMLDLVPHPHREKVTQNFIDSIVKDAEGHPSAGMVGMQWLFQALDKVDRNDIAVKMLQKTSFPSWGYMVSKGATSVWEKWNSDKAGPGMNSEGLLFLGGNINAWLFESLAGLRPDPSQPGFKHIIFRPSLAGGLSFAKASYTSMYGEIVSDWKLAAGTLKWQITVPPNTTATVYMPAKQIKDVTENGKSLSKAPGVTFKGMEKDRAVLEIGTGKYHFVSVL
jgi:alpha-L-rhamnosidase